MQISVLLLRRLLVAIAVLAVLLPILHWLPGRQVRLHERHLLDAVANRDWASVGKFLAPDYKDRWGQTREIVLQRLPQAFSNFLSCGVEASDRSTEWRNGDCIARSRIHIAGSGGPIARYVIEESQKLTEPFVLTWRKQSWKPWDWALGEVDQPQLKIPAGEIDDL